MSETDLSAAEIDPAIRRLGYLVGLLLVVIPFLQAGSQIWPLQLTNIQWRFAAANALSSVLILPFCGLSILAAIARTNLSRKFLRVLGVVAVLFTIGLAASFIVFILDALQLKAIVNTRGMPQFVGAATRVAIATVIFGGAFSVLAMSCFKKLAGESSTPTKGVKKAERGGGLIVGQGFSPTE